MTATTEDKALEDRIVSVRRLMKIGVSERHWLKLHDGVQGVLSEAFLKLDPDKIASIAELPVKTIARWMTEAQMVARLREGLDRCRIDGHLQSSRLHTVRPDICAVARRVGVNLTGRTFGINRVTVARWMKQRLDKAVPPSVSADGGPQPASEPLVLGDVTLATDTEAKQLQLFLERHKGKVRKKYSLTEKRLMLSLQERFGSKAVHDHFGVSYDTIARLKRRQESELDRKSRTPMRYIPVLDLMKKHPGMGPMQIRDYIRRHLGLAMGVNSIRKIMEQNGWVPPFVKTTRVNDGLQFYQAARKNYLWHMDFKHQYVNKCKVFILFIQDDFSRFITGHAIADGEKVDVVLNAVEDAIRVHGKPESIMNDGGSAFFAWRGSSRFTRFLEDYGIEQLIAQTPNVNGKLENLNQQVEKEVIMVTDFASVEHFRSELAKWVGFYNFSRPHQGLGDIQVPADRYFPGASHWYGKNNEITRQQSLIAETMATLLAQLKKPS